MSNVFVLDTNKRELNPVHPGEARRLLSQGKAAVLKHYPFTIILKVEVIAPVLEPLPIKLDPGSKTTGIAILNDASGEVVFAAELTHRGQQIKSAIDDRRVLRKVSTQQADTIQKAPLHQSPEQEEGLASPIVREQSLQRHHVGQSPVSGVSHHGDLARAGQVRLAKGRQP